MKTWPTRLRGRGRIVLASLVVASLAVALCPPTLAAPRGAGPANTMFGRMFPDLNGFTAPTPQELADLAQTQLDAGQQTGENAGLSQPPDIKPDTPSVFTYFGQFLDHDLTLDNVPQPSQSIDPATIPNDRTFRFDLDSVFGDGPQKTPQYYAADRVHLALQDPNPNGVPDLKRNPDGSAVIPEGRNDENELISQIQVAFVKFHNRLVDDLKMPEVKARSVETQYWQWIVLHDILPHFVGQDRVNAQFDSRGNVQTPLLPNSTFTPIEFSVGAYRFGHSIVRDAYNVNDRPDGSLNTVPVFRLNPTADTLNQRVASTADTPETLNGGRQLPAGHQLFWGYFVPKLDDAGPNDPDINFARPVDTLISNSLFQLPIPGAEATGNNVLAFRNMVRGVSYGLPSGQDVARKLGLTPIPAPELNPTGAASLNQGTPLWYYVLAESQRMEGGKRLGPTGAAIVTQTFLRVLAADPQSILNISFTPDTPIAPARGQFDVGDFLQFAGVCPTAVACGTPAATP